MRERTNPNEGSQFIEPGVYDFVVEKVSIDYTTAAKKKYYEFTFSYDDGETYKQRFMVWLVAPLLNALGYSPDKNGHYDWDTDEVVGKKIRAEIALETYTNKEGLERNRPVMIGIKGIDNSVDEKVPF